VDDEALRRAFAEAQRAVNQSAAGALGDGERLQLYGAYKQATVGRNCTKAPMMLDMVASAKWCEPCAVTLTLRCPPLCPAPPRRRPANPRRVWV